MQHLLCMWQWLTVLQSQVKLHVCISHDLFLGSPAQLTLWVGTSSGKVAVYFVKTIEERAEASSSSSSPKIELQPTGMT